MKFNTKRVQAVDDGIPYGCYVWRCPDGEFLGDGDGNLMLIFGMRNDRTKVKAIAEAASHYGFEEGDPVFLAGRRPVTDEEYQEQLQRQALGLTPDPYDLAAIRDELKADKQNGRA